MFLTILLVFLAVGFMLSTILLIGSARYNSKLAEKNANYFVQVRNQDQASREEEGRLHHELDARVAEVKRLTNKLIEVQNHSNLVEQDAARRIEEFKKQPMIACMSDGQVQVLAEMLAIRFQDILNAKKEYIN